MSAAIPIKTEEVILESVEYNSADDMDDQDMQELHVQLEDSGGETYHIEYNREVSQTSQRQRQQHQHNSSMSDLKAPVSGAGEGKNMLENEKRLRREIANSNERRRMQSINAGFQNLRSLLPRHEGDKLSKAAILQQTSTYICELETSKTLLLAQNSQLKRQLGLQESGGGGGGEEAENEVASGGVAVKKRKLTDNIISIQTISDSSDEGLGSMSPEPMTLLNAAGGQTKSQVIIAHTAAKELLDMKKQLDKERRLRVLLEDELSAIKRQLYSVATAPPSTSSGASYIQREVIEHTDNLGREQYEELPAGAVSYLEIDTLTGHQQVVVCSSIEELESEEAAAAAADMITEDVQEEVILSSHSSTESEHESNVNAIAKAYAEGTSPTAAVLQPILQAAIKATPKVEVERINETLMKVKTERIDQPSGLTRSRQNLETIVEAIRHLEGDHLFGDVAEQQKLQQQHKAQEAPLALTTKQQQAAQRTTLAELRPFLQLKGNKQLTIVSGSGGPTVTLSPQQLTSGKRKDGTSITGTATPTAIFKVQTTPSGSSSGTGDISSRSGSSGSPQVTITTAALKQCRPGVIVAKQLS